MRGEEELGKRGWDERGSGGRGGREGREVEG